MITDTLYPRDKSYSLTVDEENGSEEWWDAARDLRSTLQLNDREWAAAGNEPIPCGPADDLVEVMDALEKANVATATGPIVAWLASLPGWNGGPDHAPNPLIVVEEIDAPPALRRAVTRSTSSTGAVAGRARKATAPRQ